MRDFRREERGVRSERWGETRCNFRVLLRHCRVLSESGFAGLWDFQDSIGERVCVRRALIPIPPRHSRVCQNQDLRDYGIFRIPLASASASGGRLSLFRPVIPAKAGIQKAAALWQTQPSANRNQHIPYPYSTPSFPRKRESRVPQPSQPLETKRESQPTYPFSLDGLARVCLARLGEGWTLFVTSPPPSFPRKRESRESQPSQPPEVKIESQPTYPFSLDGRRLG